MKKQPMRLFELMSKPKICYGISPDHGRSSDYLLLTTAFDWWVKPWAHFCHLSVGPCLMWSLMFKVCVMKYPTPHLRAYHCKPHSKRLLYVNLTAGNAKWTLQTHCRAPWRPVGSVWFHVEVMALTVSRLWIIKVSISHNFLIQEASEM